MTAGEAITFTQLFPAHHISVILLSLLQAGTTLRKKADNEREDLLTNRLYKELVKTPKFRDGPLDIRLQPEILSPDSDKDTPGGKIDLLVSCGLGYEVYFSIEAKRLRVCATGTHVTFYGSPEYVKDGMMRFVTGQYAPKMRAGAMLGYVFDSKIEKARSSIDKCVRNRTKVLKMKPPSGLIKSSILAEMQIDETRHDLIERHFIIYHVLMAV